MSSIVERLAEAERENEELRALAYFSGGKTWKRAYEITDAELATLKARLADQAEARFQVECKLTVALERLAERDANAERYRWLREHPFWLDPEGMGGTEMDAAIDAARAADSALGVKK